MFLLYVNFTVFQSEPFVQLKEEENGKPLIGNDKYEGYCIDMMKLLAQRINLTYEIKLVDDGEFGSKPDNESEWNGLIGELRTKVIFSRKQCISISLIVSSA